MSLRKKLSSTLSVIFIVISITACSKSGTQVSQNPLPYQYRSASELTQMIRNGKISSLKLLNMYIDRIQRLNGNVNAVVALDIEFALKRAKAADDALKKGEIWGPLHGLPMTVKDVFEVVGMPATSGDPNFSDYMPKKNAISVQRLVDAGAIVFGKTNTPFHAKDVQSYNEVYGTTNNPWDIARTPGGSSGGSAAALAAGFTPLELGSDIGGSIRIPAHYTGVFGHKPTFGVVPRLGHLPPMPPGIPPEYMPFIPLFVVGPMARNADDLELVLKVITGSEGALKSQESKKLLPPRQQRLSDFRIAVWIDDPAPYCEVDTEVKTVIREAIKKLNAAGIKVDMKARPKTSFTEIVETYMEVYMAMAARQIPLPEHIATRQKKLNKVMAEFFNRYDVLLAPVSPTVALVHDHEGSFLTREIVINGQERPATYTIIWNTLAVVAGLPSTAAPIGLSKKGLPVGIQIISGKNEDRTTIAFARGLSKLIGGFRVPPGYEK